MGGGLKPVLSKTIFGNVEIADAGFIKNYISDDIYKVTEYE